MNVPAVVNVRVYVAPVASVALVAVPSSHLTLCEGPSWLVQVTLAPDFTVRLAGANAKFWIVTASPATAGWLAAVLASALAAALGAATLGAGLAGAAVGLAALPHAASARLADSASPMISVRRMGVPFHSDPWRHPTSPCGTAGARPAFRYADGVPPGFGGSRVTAALLDT